MTDRSISAGYLAFPDFHTAALWYALYGRPNPDSAEGGGSSDNQTLSEGEDDGEAQPTEQGDDGAVDNDDEAAEDAVADSGGTETVGEDQPAPGHDAHGEAIDDDSIDFENEGDTTGEREEEETGRGLERDTVNEKEFELTNPTEQQPPHSFYRKVEKANGDVEIIREFPSWYEFVMNVKNAPRGWTGAATASRAGSKSFTGTDSWDEAIDMALNRGWPEGRELLSDLAAQVAPRPQAVETWNYDVAGSFPSVPMYCAGDPTCMLSEINPEQRNAHPIVRIDMNIAVNCLITQKVFMTRGAAMLSFAQTLENLGYSTEIRIVIGGRNDKFTIRTSIVFKEAGQPIDLDRAAFAIAHPSTLRRLVFALYEQHKEIETDFEYGYGFPIPDEGVDPTSGKPGGAILIPGPKTNRETHETARQLIEQAARVAGFVDETFAQDEAA